MSRKQSKDDSNSIQEQTAEQTATQSGEILSQEEMSALLSAYQSVNQGDQKGDREVRLYDFARPDKFARDHMRRLRTIHSNFAMGLSSVLTSLCQSPAAVELITVDQATFDEYRASIPDKTLLVEVALEPLGGNILFEANSAIVGSWVDSLCGGSPHLPSEPSNLTPIDLAVARHIFSNLLQVYSECWAGIVEISPEIRHMVSSQSYDEMILPGDAVLTCSFELNINETTGMMSICIPAAGVEAVIPALSAARMMKTSSNKQTENSDPSTILRVLQPASLPCRAVLGNASISFSDAVSLDVGDVIKTNSKADSEIELHIGSKPMFNCRPGVKGKSLAVVISSAVETSAEAEDAAPTDSEEEPSMQQAA